MDGVKGQGSIAIVIVNYRTAQLTIDCLASIHADRHGGYQVRAVVADNDSQDGSLALITEAIVKNDWGSWVSLRPLSRNGGFAYGNNRVIEEVLCGPRPADYVWLLNPDTLVRSGAITALADFLAAHPEVGIVGSRLEDLDGTPQVSAFRDHSVVSELLAGMQLGILDVCLAKWMVAPPPDATTPLQTDWVSGASMMVRREVLLRIGLLDERFFMYYEEVDLCLRARQAGWQCWHVPASRVVHFAGAATRSPVVGHKERRRPHYWFESRRRFFGKHYGRPTLMLADLAWMAGRSSWLLRNVIQRKPDLAPPHFLCDFFRQSFLCKGFKMERTQARPGADGQGGSR